MKPELPPYHFFDETLRFTMSHLKHALAIVHTLPVIEVAGYVDAVTYQYVKQGNVPPGVYLPDEITREVVLNMNTTAFGNAAFIALYHPNDKVRETFRNIYEVMVQIKAQL